MQRVGRDASVRDGESWHDAELLSAAWMRRLGFPDASVTAPGTDDGIDVFAAGAVGQTKAWASKRVGIGDVQRLRGAAMPGQACFFFSASGYTKAAVRSATSGRIGLFRLDSEGMIHAVNSRARRALLVAPPWRPRRERSAAGWRFAIAAAAFALLLAIVWTSILPLSFLQNGRAPSGTGLTVWVFVELAELTGLVMLWADIREGLRQRIRRGVWPRTLRTEPARVLPPNEWRGYLPLTMFERLIVRTLDLPLWLGAARAWIRTRALRNRLPGGEQASGF